MAVSFAAHRLIPVSILGPVLMIAFQRLFRFGQAMSLETMPSAGFDATNSAAAAPLATLDLHAIRWLRTQWSCH